MTNVIVKMKINNLSEIKKMPKEKLAVTISSRFNLPIKDISKTNKVNLVNLHRDLDLHYLKQDLKEKFINKRWK
jgi:CRISPR/Cas system-associated exonuclease Cas4 (RecB family)